VANWTFLTNHARALLCIARDPGGACATSRPAWASPSAAPTASSPTWPGPATSSSTKTAAATATRSQAHLPLPEPNRRERAVRYAALRHPEHAASISRVFAIPPKRWDRTIVTFLAEPETDALLAAPDRSTWTGRPDQALLLRDPKLPVHRCQGRHLLLRRPRHAHRRPPLDARRNLIKPRHLTSYMWTIPSFRVSESDIVEVPPRSRELTPFAVARAEAGERPVLAWLEVIPDKMRILVHALPARAQIDTLVQEQLITEYYSK
jgi:hypothetical protein